MPLAREVYVSHRRGAVPLKRWTKGSPTELNLTFRRRQMGQFLQKHFPRLSDWAANAAVAYIGRRTFGALDPEWRLEPFPSVTLTLPGMFEPVMPFLQDGSLVSLPGIKRFLGDGKSVEFTDGTVLEDVDAVILCTGYSADWSVAAPSFLETSKPPDSGRCPALPRLYMNLFPPRYADSCALLCHSAFGKSNGFGFADVMAWAVANVFRGTTPADCVPSTPKMERHIDDHHAWVASRWKQGGDEFGCDVSMVRQWEFQTFLHKAAGTGVLENLGWWPSWSGWKFWWREREMYNLMVNGVETSHMFRYFDTGGQRPVWEGAGEAIRRLNGVVKGKFPLKEGEEGEEGGEEEEEG